MTPGYRALREHAAWIDLSHRGKIRVSGEDRARLLHAMCTNHVEQLKPGEGCYAFFLNAQGRILADANILCFEDHFLLDTEPETRASLFEHLDRYIIADDVALEDATDQLHTIAIEGPESQTIVRIDLPEYHSILRDREVVARLNSTGSDGLFIFTPDPPRFDIPQASQDDARTVRIENGKPRYGEEISDRFLVAETDQLQALHFNKGCYIGQEIVERVRSRASIHRILRRLEIDTTEPMPAGLKTDQLEIASAVFSPALGKIAALAYVRTPFAEPGTKLTLNGVEAVVASAHSTAVAPR